jgi:hypothetical protein
MANRKEMKYRFCFSPETKRLSTRKKSVTSHAKQKRTINSA